MAGNAQKSAASSAAGANKYAVDLQRDIYNQGREDFAPYLEGGHDAMNALSNQGRTGQYVETENPEYTKYMKEKAAWGKENQRSPGEMIESGTTNLLKGYKYDKSKTPLFNADRAKAQGFDVNVGNLDFKGGSRGVPSQSYEDIHGAAPGQYSKEWQVDENSPKYGDASQNALEAYQNIDTGGLPSADINTPASDQGFVDPNSVKIDPKMGYTDPNSIYGDPNSLVGDPNLPSNLNLDLQSDPVFQWKQEQMEKSVNKNLAARGLHNSSAGMNALSDANMKLISQEGDKQYGRAVDEYNRNYGREMDMYGVGMDKSNTTWGRQGDIYGATAGQRNALADRTYGMNSDTYNRQMDQGQTQYGREYGTAMDQFNRELGLNDTQYNRDQSKGVNEYNMINALDNQDYGRDLDLAKIGTGAASAAGSMGVATGQGVANSYANMGNANIAQGNANAQMWAGLGAMPMNYLAANYYTGNPSQNAYGSSNPPSGFVDPLI